MRRVVRNKKSHAFLKADGGWAVDFRSAYSFPDTRSAMAACTRHGVAGAELLLIMGPEPCADYDIALPLGEPENTEPDSAARFERYSFMNNFAVPRVRPAASS